MCADCSEISCTCCMSKRVLCVCVDHVVVCLENETQVKRGRMCTLPHHEGKNRGGIAYITNLEMDGIEEGSDKGSGITYG